MTTEALVATLIENAIATASNQASTANTLIESANAAIAWEMRDVDPPPPPGDYVVRPVFDKPVDEDGIITYKTDYDATALALTAQLNGIFGGFLDEYFPSLDQYSASADAWINNTIVNGGTGIPADVEAQIWQRGRDKEAADAARLVYEAQSAFAARGFSLPSGALAARMIEVQQEAANKSSTYARDVAVKQIDVEIENIRFAVKLAVDARLAGITAAIEYWKAYLLPHKIAADRAGALIDAKLKFTQALASWFSAEASLFSSEITNQGNYWSQRTEGYKANAIAVSGLAKAQGDTAAAGAKAAADIAAAAMSAMNTLASVGSEETRSL